MSRTYPGEKYITPRELPAKDRRLRIALVYPDSYFTGMSNLGVQAVWGLIRERTPYEADLFFFTPELGLHRHSTDAQSHSRASLRDYDIIAFSFPYEPLYANMLAALNASGVGLRPSERIGAPIIVAGGYAVTANPMPIADFVDVAFIGEAEEAFPPFLDAVLAHLSALKSPQGSQARDELLKDWHGHSRFFCPNIGADEGAMSRAMVADLSQWDTVSRIVARNTVFANRMLMQTSRGCGAGCAFCLAGHITRPLRHLPAEEIMRRAHLADGITDRIGIIAAAPTDHPHIADIARELAAAKFKLSFSSLKLAALTDELVRILIKGGQQTFTIAPEVLDEPHRRIIRKPFPTNAEIIAHVRRLIALGVPKLKFYFMLGFDFEDDAYLRALGEWLTELDAASQGAGKHVRPNVSFAFSFFVPKAQTPLELAPMQPVAELERRKSLVKKHYHGRGGLSFESAQGSLLQERLSRGGREAGALVEYLAQHGMRASSVKAALQAFGVEAAAASPVRAWPALTH